MGADPLAALRNQCNVIGYFIWLHYGHPLIVLNASAVKVRAVERTADATRRP